MKKAWTTIVDDVQAYLAQGIGVLPFVYVDFLLALAEAEKQNKSCLLPQARFEAYHARLERSLRHRIQRQQQRAA